MTPEPPPDHPTPRADLWIGLFAFVFGLAAAGLVPGEVAKDGLTKFGDVRSPAFFPITAAAFLVVLSVALVLRAVRAGALSGIETGVARPSPKVLAVGGALALAGVAIFWLGFFVTAALLIAGLTWIFGEHRLLRIATLAVCVPLGIQILFREMLNVLLPSGVW
ncbi:MAG: tripartite tricarboxylate transporter TctB family protein [Rhodobacteraceae bacterium]|nr:tripartite tricarboxylate transporter TctB family protein [Paracoccaceae bacterium]